MPGAAAHGPVRMLIEILVNPVSGRGRGPERAARIAELLSARGHGVGVHQGRSRADAIAWARNAGGMADRLLVVGGDGSLNAVVNGLSEDPPPVALSPLGTANLLGYELGLPSDAEETAAVVEGGHVRRVDLAQVRFRDHEGREEERCCFLCAGFGFDGEVMRRMDETRTGPIHKAHYLRVLGETVRDWAPAPQEVAADDEELPSAVYGVFSGVSVYGLPQLKLGRCAVDDGWWELTLLPSINLLQGAVLAAAAAGGALDRVPGVVQRKLRAARVAAGKPTPVQVDGDWVGSTPLEFSMSGRQLPVLVAP